MTFSGIAASAGSAPDSVTVTVADAPSVSRLGSTDSDTVGVSSSSMPISTEVGLPAVTVAGSLAVSMATVNVSSSLSSSCRVAMRPVPLVRPLEIEMLESVPRSVGSDVPSVTVSGMLTERVAAAESVAVTVTVWPSGTGFGLADSDTVASSSLMVTSIEVVAPGFRLAGSDAEGHGEGLSVRVVVLRRRDVAPCRWCGRRGSQLTPANRSRRIPPCRASASAGSPRPPAATGSGAP